MYSEIASNKRRSVFIMLFFMIFAGAIAWIFGEYTGSPSLTIAVLIGAIAYATITYFAGSRLSLAVNGAKEIQRKDNPRLWRIIENLAITDGLPMPRVFVINDPAPNAFATGRNPNKAAVCATTGLLEIMNDDELQGVFAHELGHVKNYDIRVSMIAFALSAVISILADVILRMTWFRPNNREEENNQLFLIVGIVAAILAPLIATLIQLAISRSREYEADHTGAEITGNPMGLARALDKIDKWSKQLPMRVAPSMAHLYCAQPLTTGRVFSSLFSTHPPIPKRIERLIGRDFV